MTSFRRAALWVAASICLSLSLSTSLFAQRADRAPSAVSSPTRRARGSRRQRHHPQRRPGVDTVLVDERVRRLHVAAAGAGSLLGDRRPYWFQEDGHTGHRARGRRRSSVRT